MNNSLIHDLNRSGAGLALVIVMLACAALAVAIGYTMGEDAAIKRLTQKQEQVAALERELQKMVKAAEAEAFIDGRFSVQCIGGFAVDRRTGKPFKLAEAR